MVFCVFEASLAGFFVFVHALNLVVFMILERQTTIGPSGRLTTMHSIFSIVILAFNYGKASSVL